MRKLTFALNILFLFLLAACSSDNRSPEAAPATASSMPTETQGKPEAPGGSADAIRFERSGGFAGVEEVWVVTSDGVVSLNGDIKATASEEQLEQLLREIEALGFFEMQNSYLPLDTCCDRFTYVLTVEADGQKNSVSTIDAADNAPAELWEIFAALADFFAEYSE